jgi:hypothetical protein
MRRCVVLLCLVALVSVVSVFYVHFYQHSRSEAGPQGFPYVLAPDEIKSLRGKAEHGDCEASFRLAKYFLYGALDLEAGTHWLRLAAKCPDATTKEYLVEILKRSQDPAASQEVDQLLVDIRKVDPAWVAKFNDQHIK